MYANQVDLGHGNFGFAAASQFYFSKPINRTDPSRSGDAGGNPPLAHRLLSAAPSGSGAPAAGCRAPGHAWTTERLRAAQWRQASAAPLGLKIQRWNYTVAPYFIEEVRQFLERKYGPEAVREKGLRVYTTTRHQNAEVAEEHSAEGLRDDDKRRGWRGPQKNILKTPPARGGRPARHFRNLPVTTIGKGPFSAG